MNKYTMGGITSSGVLAGALLGPIIFNALKGTAESPTAVVRRNLLPIVVGGLIGGYYLAQVPEDFAPTKEDSEKNVENISEP